MDAPLAPAALYPGTFDGLTYGHLDIMRRAASLFGRLHVAVAVNASKKPMFTVEERTAILLEETRGETNIRVEHFEGLTVEHAVRIGAKAIIRGLRVASDFEYEWQMALMNRDLDARVETLFLAPSAQTLFVSSSLVKEILLQGGDISRFVPPATERYMRSKFNLPPSER